MKRQYKGPGFVTEDERLAAQANANMEAAKLAMLPTSWRTTTQANGQVHVEKLVWGMYQNRGVFQNQHEAETYISNNSPALVVQSGS